MLLVSKRSRDARASLPPIYDAEEDVEIVEAVSIEGRPSTDSASPASIASVHVGPSEDWATTDARHREPAPRNRLQIRTGPARAGSSGGQLTRARPTTIELLRDGQSEQNEQRDNAKVLLLFQTMVEQEQRAFAEAAARCQSNADASVENAEARYALKR